MHFWDTRSLDLITTLSFTNPISCFVYKGHNIAVGASTPFAFIVNPLGTVDFIDMRTWKPLFTVNHHHNRYIHQLQFDCYKLVALSTDKTMKIWNLNDGSILNQTSSAMLGFYPVSFEMDWKSMVMGCDDGVVRILQTYAPDYSKIVQVEKCKIHLGLNRSLGSFEIKAKRFGTLSDEFLNRLVKTNPPTSPVNQPPPRLQLVPAPFRFYGWHLMEQPNNTYSDVKIQVENAEYPFKEIFWR